MGSVLWNNEPLQLGMRRMSSNVQPAVRQLLVLGAARIDELEMRGEAEVTGDVVRAWLHAHGLDVHPKQRKKLAALCEGG